MTREIPSREPSDIVAGDTIEWYRTDLTGDFPASGGWTLAYTLRLRSGTGNKITVNAAASGDAFLVTILAATSANFRQRWLLPGARGDKHEAYAITEELAGSDLTGLRATARRDGDEYVINGSKMWITNGTRADFITLAVRTGGPGHEGISLVTFPTDVRGFSGIAETLSPEALREYINAYLTEMSTIIRARHHGTLDKYIGDAIMAFWGAPVDDPQHARNAVLAALEMQKGIGALNEAFAARGWPRLAIGVGVNSGTVRVGDMGSRLRRAYTAMGDAVNVASRLEGRTKNYAVGILVGEATRARVKDVVFREIDRIRVKGKDEAITVYEPLGESRDLSQWQAVLRAYRAREWDAAEGLLRGLQRAEPGCGLYGAYLKKVQDLRRDPPPADWDGVTVFHEK